jgi:hypothetical protein
MADNPKFLSALAQANSGVVATDGGGIGDLRRRYNFGPMVSELGIDQTPFFRFLSMAARKPTDDPEWKSIEQRHSWMKRYAYVVAVDQNGTAGNYNSVADSAYDKFELSASNVVKDAVFSIKLEADYKSAGNVQSILGQTAIAIGASGTQPEFLMAGQLLKIPIRKHDTAVHSLTDNAVPTSAMYDEDYIVVRIAGVSNSATGNDTDAHASYASVKVVRGLTVGDYDLFSIPGAYYHAGGTTFDAFSLAAPAEGDKCYVVGSAHPEGSTFPDTWKDSPFKDVYGLTQIFKTTCQMTNTARATQLKLVADEWARMWKQKLIEHKWDIETALLFNAKGKDSTDGTLRYTQGVVDYILNNGNLFAMDLSKKTSDDFLEDMSNYVDPRYNNAGATLFMVSTEVYNWLHKLSGYFANNAANVQPGGFDGTASSAAFPAGSSSASLGRADMAISGKGKKFGLDITRISTPYGDMNVTRNIHLDGAQSAAKIVAVNMKHVAYRPLVGNGVNRDTSIYVGVQSLENTGKDRRIDLIQTEAGLDIVMPEAHAIWK